MNMDKLVCNCMKISNGTIRDAVFSGANTLEEVQEITKAGTVCGKCKENVQHLMDQFLTERT